MRHFRFVCIATITALALFCSASVSAQSDPNFETGLKPFGSYDGGNIDSINLNNLSLSIALPLMSYPQTGGKLKLDFDFRINNFSYYYTVGYIDCPDGNGECGTTDWEEPGTIFGITQEGVPVYAASWTDNGTQYIGQAQITTPDQAVHQLGLTALSGGYWRSADATGYAIAGTYTGSVTGPIFDANGLRYSLSNEIIPNGAWYGTSVEDANGNQISLQSIGVYPNHTIQWTDSVGRIIPAPASTTNYSNCPNPSGTTSAKIWNLPGLNGATYPLLFCYGGSVLTQYFYWQTCGCDGTQGELEQYSAYGPMLQYIVLPNNTYWTFAYTSDGNSNISQITFPTGGALCYTWHNIVGGNTDGPYYEMTSHVASRTLDPSGTCSQSSPTWAYSQTFPSGNVITTVTDPAGNNTVHHFTFPTGVQTYYETETDYPAGKTVYYICSGQYMRRDKWCDSINY